MVITEEKIASLQKEYSEKMQDCNAQVTVWKGRAEHFKTKLEVLAELANGGSSVPKIQERALGAAVGKYAGMETNQ